MTEAEWLECEDLDKMLEFLQGKASDRKLRLFACACCRRIWQLLDNPRSRMAVEAGERFADGEILPGQADEAALAVDLVAEASSPPYALDADVAVRAAASAWAQYPDPAHEAARSASWAATNVAAIHGTHTDQAAYWDRLSEARSVERAEQARLLRDVLGMPPFKFTPVNPLCLTWGEAVVVKLAQGIYDDRGFDRLPVLADALEEAGCTDAVLVAHLRSPGPHVRGCWALDAILGKE